MVVIVTSATIDADRFAQHFASAKGPGAGDPGVRAALFRSEQRWRPFEESREYDLNHAISDALDELWREGAGDILVFLPGEREIREAADHLRKHHPPGVEVLPFRPAVAGRARPHLPTGTARAAWCWPPTWLKPR